MKQEDFSGTVDFSVSTGLVPWGDPSEYVHTVTGKALVLTDSGDEEEAGKITLRLVSATEAVNQGEQFYDVCDADSAVLEAIYATLFDTNGETKDELDIEPGWHNLLFVETVKIGPDFRNTSLRVQMIETAIAMFCSEGLVVAVEDSLELSAEEWRKLGFKRIAESQFVFRDQLRVNPYRKTRLGKSLLDGQDEGRYICNACGEEIVISLDLSAGSIQEYIEDCPVCCNPNVIHIDYDEDGDVQIWAESE